ncbi:MAG: tyrosine-type recombinase/integrase [Aquabacterium sp.]
MPLTDTAVRNAKPADKVQRLFDGGGLYLELAPSGGKWWRLKYRVAGKEKRISLGTYPDVSLKEARERRDLARKQLTEGEDPSENRKAAKAAELAVVLTSFAAVAGAWMDHMGASKWDEGTRDKIRASMESHVFPVIGQKPVSLVRPADVRELVKKVDAAGSRETAGRLFQRIKAVYRYAVSHDLTDNDPTSSLKPSEFMSQQKVQHRAALAEKDVPQFVRLLEDYPGDLRTSAALRLLMLTAVRPGELRGARWDEFDLDRALWRIPAERMKMKIEHTVPLSVQALAVLKGMHPGGDAVGLVFPSPYHFDQPISDGTLNKALARMGYKGAATAHGFRTLFSTCANEAGKSTDIIEKQLAHQERDDVRAAYNRASWLPQRQELMQWWGDHLDAIEAGAKVIAFRTA